MSDFVNKIKTKDGSEYDIHDNRLDGVESGSIQDVLGLNEDGELVKGSIGGSSPFIIYEGNSSLVNLSLNDLVALNIGVEIPSSFSSKKYTIYSIYDGSLYELTISNYGSLTVDLIMEFVMKNGNYYTFYVYHTTSGSQIFGDYSNEYIVVPKPTITGTFTLKSVDGTPTWVQDQ